VGISIQIRIRVHLKSCNEERADNNFELCHGFSGLRHYRTCLWFPCCFQALRGWGSRRWKIALTRRQGPFSICLSARQLAGRRCSVLSRERPVGRERSRRTGACCSCVDRASDARLSTRARRARTELLDHPEMHDNPSCASQGAAARRDGSVHPWRFRPLLAASVSF